MQDFFKYLTPSHQDIQWGLYLNVAGRATIHKTHAYPPHGHPTGYHFTWEKGRILEEFQINFITQGSGIYENKDSIYQVRPGTLLITKPGEWHRYKPHKRSGWVENYIGFNGTVASDLMNTSILLSLKPVLNMGSRGELIDTYLKIFEYLQKEKPGYQQVAAAMVMKLLGYIVSAEKQKSFTEKPVEQLIQKACLLIRENIDKDFDLREFAMSHHVGYSYFRKMFSKYTGMAPLQYQLDLKIMRSRELLLSTNKSVKEISYELGFQSAYYFSRIFKKKLGITPSSLRK